MKWLNSYRMRLVLVGCVVAIVLGGGRAKAEIIMSEPTNLGPVINHAGGMQACDFSHDGLELYFAPYSRSGGFGGGNIWVSRRETLDSPWQEPVNLGPNVNSSGDDFCPSISTDDLTLVFMRGSTSMWVATRKSVADDWGSPVEIINRRNFNGPAISPDGSTIYFDANTQYWGGYGSGDILQVKFIPIVDFNSDEIVDIADLVILIEHWGKQEALCDIGPLPLGDGVVDEADLKVFMSYWGQEAYDPTLIAYWKLDETEGDIAYNSINDDHGIISGNPAWHPDSGQVDGALQFDGIDDYVSTDFVLNPSDSPFSVFAWIKDGAAGQAILSQEYGVNWLMADSVDGALQTDLKEPTSVGRDPKPLSPPLIS